MPGRALLIALALLAGAAASTAGGVTVVTHGFAGNVTDWVIPMCNKMAQYPSFPGSNVTVYQISVTQAAPGVYVATPSFLDGVSPSAADSGEILIALDWSTLSTGSVPSTTVASVTANALLTPGFITDLGGRALAELPLHLVGHSRGGSLVLELARYLGAQGVWVDQVTTLDPHPAFGDPPVTNYANILYTDNYWQNLGDNLFVPNGTSVPGAYNRHLIYLTGGYTSTHSDVHLWYHGTIDLATPASDTKATITSTERATWWTSPEAYGANAGFLYSVIGGGNRLSALEPAGAGNGRISDGFNKQWDLGGGVAANRTPLPANNAAWPNVIRCNVSSAATLPTGRPFTTAFYYQFGTGSLSTANLEFWLDPDRNPYNANATLLGQFSLSGTGTGTVKSNAVSLATDPATIRPGAYNLLTRITYAGKSRVFYAPEKLTLTASTNAPVLAALGTQSNLFYYAVQGYPGQTVVIQASTNLTQWLPVSTNTLQGTALTLSDPLSPGRDQRYYRAQLKP